MSIRSGSNNMANKKIAFLFLIYGQIDHEELWYEFFSKDLKNRHSIYIHYKNDKKLKYLENCKLTRCVDTKWGHISLVHAQNLTLREALKDELNDRFVFCSGTCIPLKSFEYIYHTIDPKFSYFNMRPDEDSFPRCQRATKYISKQYIKKASQWCILNRDHVKILLATDKYIEWFRDTIGDEHCYVTYLHYLKLEKELITTNNAAEYATTFTNWSDVKYIYPHAPKATNVKNYTYISMKELIYLINSPCLFGRKFLKECELSGLKRILSYLDINDKQKEFITPWTQQEIISLTPVIDSSVKHDQRYESSHGRVIVSVSKMMQCDRR